MKNNLLILLDVTMPIWLAVLGIILGPTGIAAAFITFVRFRKKDRADITKTDAETEKIKAEATEIKAKAEVSIASESLKLAKALSDQCEITKKELEQTQEQLDKANEILRDLREKNYSCMSEVNRLRVEIERYQRVLKP